MSEVQCNAIHFHFSHRPVDIHNVYNAVQIKLLVREAELVVPEYDDVFRDDEDGVRQLLIMFLLLCWVVGVKVI